MAENYGLSCPTLWLFCDMPPAAGATIGLAAQMTSKICTDKGMVITYKYLVNLVKFSKTYSDGGLHSASAF